MGNNNNDPRFQSQYQWGSERGPWMNQGAYAPPKPAGPTQPNLNTIEGLKAYVEENLKSYGAKAKSGEAEEERRGQGFEDYLRQAEAQAHKPTITEEDINRRMSMSSDQASGGFLDNMAGLREYMGESGVTGGGLPAGIAANAEIQRLGQLTTARGDLMAYKATADALDRQRDFDRATTVGQAINRPISMLGIDFENQALQTRLAELGIQTNLEGNKMAAKATKDAAKMSKTGNLLGAGISAFPIK